MQITQTTLLAATLLAVTFGCHESGQKRTIEREREPVSGAQVPTLTSMSSEPTPDLAEVDISFAAERRTALVMSGREASAMLTELFFGDNKLAASEKYAASWVKVRGSVIEVYESGEGYCVRLSSEAILRAATGSFEFPACWCCWFDDTYYETLVELRQGNLLEISGQVVRPEKRSGELFARMNLANCKIEDSLLADAE